MLMAYPLAGAMLMTERAFQANHIMMFFFYSPIPKREIAVVCFEIAPEYRGKGIATALLNKVIMDAKINKYASVVGFPVKRSERYEWDCAGPIRLYEKAGFHKISEHGETIIMKKELM